MDALSYIARIQPGSSLVGGGTHIKPCLFDSPASLAPRGGIMCYARMQSQILADLWGDCTEDMMVLLCNTLVYPWTRGQEARTTVVET